MSTIARLVAPSKSTPYILAIWMIGMYFIITGCQAGTQELGMLFDGNVNNPLNAVFGNN